MLQTIELPVIEAKQETPTVHSIKLEKNNFGYKPGQYVMMELDTDDEEKIHPLSIASSPTEDFLLFSTKISQSSFKQKLHSLKVRDKIKIKGPMGAFILKEDAQNILFLGGGIGITPLRSMIKYSTDKKLPIKMTLLYSNRNAAEICYKDEWPLLEKQNPKLKVVNTITDENADWSGRKGRINEQMIKEFCDDLQNTLFCTCGPPAMVDAMLSLLKSMNVPQQNIRREVFTGY